MDELKGSIPQETDFNKRTAEIIGILVMLGILLLVTLILCTSGCVTATKQTYHQIVDTPTPTPTPEPTEEPEIIEEPQPTVTEDPIAYMLRTNGYRMRDWHQWFKADVQGINGQGTKDLHTLVTVYDYRFLDSYRWWSVSWARRFVVKPDDRLDQFLFIFVNMYSDDTGDGSGDDVRQYGMGCDHFSAQIDGRIYQTDWIEYPDRRITEFDDFYTYDHVQTPGPYGFKIVQERGSGVISAQQLEWLMGGRSNSWDGWCLFQLPRQDTQGNPVNASNTKILGNFGNLGGQVWWSLDK
jgi:hypothetical protein